MNKKKNKPGRPFYPAGKKKKTARIILSMLDEDNESVRLAVDRIGGTLNDFYCLPAFTRAKEINKSFDQKEKRKAMKKKGKIL